MVYCQVDSLAFGKMSENALVFALNDSDLALFESHHSGSDLWSKLVAFKDSEDPAVSQSHFEETRNEDFERSVSLDTFLLQLQAVSPSRTPIGQLTNGGLCFLTRRGQGHGVVSSAHVKKGTRNPVLVREVMSFRYYPAWLTVLDDPLDFLSPPSKDSPSLE